MWYAELLIGTNADLPDKLAEKFAARVSGNTDHESILKDTIHKDSTFLIATIVCSFRDQSIAFFVTKSDARTLAVHIERVDRRASVRELKATVKEVIGRLGSFLKHHGIRIKRVDGEVFAFGNKELTCARRSSGARLADAFKSNWLSKAYVPAATVGASLLLGTKLEQSIFNAAVALIALTIWILIEAVLAEPYTFYEV